ncbi:hypothetical protein GCM10010961_27720 [Pseudodonghicola xiamenensis]|uniref:Uncharacterized protein n=1 Tax=Pseudodonghicola xiamenensis TaxID=337702 RepID=A0A8J3H8S9_9RHOB|nr:hypothetical protein GCM10010961_27720 [Pseudodonghicola xiamenensis]
MWARAYISSRNFCCTRAAAGPNSTSDGRHTPPVVSVILVLRVAGWFGKRPRNRGFQAIAAKAGNRVVPHFAQFAGNIAWMDWKIIKECLGFWLP